MATKSKTALWDVTPETDGEFEPFVVAVNGKAKAESQAAQMLAEKDLPAAKFRIALASGDTIADDLLAGIDGVKAPELTDAEVDAARLAAEGKGSTTAGQEKRARQAKPVSKAQTAGRARKGTKKADEPTAASAKRQIAAAAKAAPARKATAKGGPTINDRLDKFADEAAEMWKTIEVGEGDEVTPRILRKRLRDQLAAKHPKEGTLFDGRIPALLSRSKIDANQVPAHLKAAR